MTTAVAASRGDLCRWLVDRVAFYLDKPPEGIDPKVDLSRYGMDSIYAVSVVSDVEDHLQVEVDLAEARKMGTIEALTDYLLELTAR